MGSAAISSALERITRVAFVCVSCKLLESQVWSAAARDDGRICMSCIFIYLYKVHAQMPMPSAYT